MPAALREKLLPYPSLAALVVKLLEVWPDHRKYLLSRFMDNSDEFLSRSEEISELVTILMDNNIDEYCLDYRWMCTNFNEDQKYFARHKEYRLTTFEEASEQVYSNTSYMARYVHGILLSQILWHNHAQAIDCFRTAFLPKCRVGGDYLEVGPGHGLFLYFAARGGQFGTCTGWDYSEASIQATQHTLDKFKLERPVSLVQQDVLKASTDEESFDAIVISEVLEHLEEPEEALKSLHRCLRPGGRIFANIPINSPAPDHIYLWRTPEAVNELLRKSGFENDEEHYYPVTGYSLEQALKRDLGVSCVIFAKKS